MTLQKLHRESRSCRWEWLRPIDCKVGRNCRGVDRWEWCLNPCTHMAKSFSRNRGHSKVIHSALPNFSFDFFKSWNGNQTRNWAEIGPPWSPLLPRNFRNCFSEIQSYGASTAAISTNSSRTKDKAASSHKITKGDVAGQIRHGGISKDEQNTSNGIAVRKNSLVEGRKKSISHHTSEVGSKSKFFLRIRIYRFLNQF